MSEVPEKAVLTTNLLGAISRRSGKVRDIYEYEQGLLLVATDRISAFDCVMPNGIPGKGKILTALSVFWFDETRHIVPNHLLSVNVEDFPAEVAEYRDMLAGRTMWVRKAKVIPVECVVRGYLSGSGWRSYKQTGEICDHNLPEGLVESDRLPEPIFTPATKAPSGHDENITWERVVEITGPSLAKDLREKTLELYQFAADFAHQRGFILADTKFEFGLVNGDLILIDELLTPDASRYWDVDQYEPGRPQQAYDKQYVRDYLDSLDWDKEPPAPELPAEVIAQTREIYLETLHRITGQ